MDANKSKILNLGLILTSLFGYLEWGTDMQMFLFQGEYEVVSKLIRDPMSVVHPFTLLPLIGQLLLLITLFQKQPSKRLTFMGLFGMGILLLFICIVGVIALNYKIALSTLPYLFVSFLTIRHLQKNRPF